MGEAVYVAMVTQKCGDQGLLQQGMGGSQKNHIDDSIENICFVPSSGGGRDS